MRTGLPQFERVLELETTSETSANVSIGDLNGDGNLDLLLAKGRHWPLMDRVLLGDGRGHIAAAFNLGDAADRTYSGLLVDLDGDTDLDVVISNDDPDPKLVYLNDAKGHFRVGSTFGRAEWESRHALLDSEAAWNQQDDRDCHDDERTGRRSLFCALQRACGDVLGRYDHRRVALQEVRFAVEDATRGRTFEHRLRDFNNLPETRLSDVRRVLSVAKQRVAGRLRAKP